MCTQPTSNFLPLLPLSSAPGRARRGDAHLSSAWGTPGSPTHRPFEATLPSGVPARAGASAVEPDTGAATSGEATGAAAAGEVAASSAWTMGTDLEMWGPESPCFTCPCFTRILVYWNLCPVCAGFHVFLEPPGCRFRFMRCKVKGYSGYSAMFIERRSAHKFLVLSKSHRSWLQQNDGRMTEEEASKHQSNKDIEGGTSQP